MKPWLRWVSAVLVLAAAVHLLTVLLYPKAIMLVAMHLLGDRAGGANKVYHAPQVTVENNEIVMQSPDLLYSACMYDVSDGPVLIEAPVPDSYWSVSIYRDDTVNFFVMNDRQAEGGRAQLLLLGAGNELPGRAELKPVRAPTEKGIVLFRTLIKDFSDVDQLVENQRRASCTALDWGFDQ